jgi:hypothetical protein
VCTACTIGKAKQKAISFTDSDDVKEMDTKTRIYLDLSSIKKPKDIKQIHNRHCRILVDEKTQMKFVDFFETKNGMVEPTCEKFKLWEQHGHKVEVVRMDNGGENIKLESRAKSKDWQLGIVFEKTARDTPQQNSLAEIGLTVIANKARALMTQANIPRRIKYKIFREAYKTAAILDGYVVIKRLGIEDTRYVHWCGANPNFTTHLRTWGEAGTVKVKTKTTPKIEDRGVQCIFVGYALGHTGDTYRMWDPKTGGIHVSRDIIWLNQMYYKNPTDQEYVELHVNPLNVQADEEADEESSSHSTDNDADDDVNVEETVDQADEDEEKADEDTVEEDEEIEENANDVNEDSETNVEADDVDKPVVTRTRSGRAVNRPRRFLDELGAGTFDTLTLAEKQYFSRLDEIGCFSMGLVGAGVGGGFQDTHELHVMKYEQAMKSKDKNAWEIAVKEEHDRMKKYKVFKAVSKDKLPKQAKILTSTWAMKKKSSGVYRARVTARGYEQIDGVHYDKDTKASPVVNEATILIVFVLMLFGDSLLM